MVESSNDSRSDRGDVTLIDIACVVLRWRKIVLIPTMVAVAASIGWIALTYIRALSGDGSSKTVSWTIVEYKVHCADYPCSFVTTQDIFRTFNDVRLVESAIESTGITRLGDEVVGNDGFDGSRIHWIRQRVIQNKDILGSALPESERLFEVEASGGFVKLSVKDGTKERVTGFLERLADLAEIELSNIARKNAELAAAYEGFEKLSWSNDPTIPDIRELSYNRYMAAKAFLRQLPTIIERKGDPYVETQSLARVSSTGRTIKICILICCVVFTLSFFSVFLVNAIDAARKDPTTKARFEEALRKGGTRKR